MDGQPFRSFSVRWSIAAVAIAAAMIGGLRAQPAVPAGEWRAYGGDDRTDRYSPLDQFNRDNVKSRDAAL